MIEESGLNIELGCDAFEISKSSYYRWKRQPPLAPDAIRDVIKDIAFEFPRYGYRRITKTLHRRGKQVNHKRVRRIMKEEKLTCSRKRYTPLTTNSNHWYGVYPNLAKRIRLTSLNQLWVADITYIRLRQEFVYLAVVIDVFSRRCIGWQLSRNIDTQLTLDALEMAISERRPLGFAELIHHSDQRVQYAATAYVERLAEEGITSSMSRRGNPKDNAFAESFMKTLKVEEVHMNEYQTFEEAYDNIKEFIEQVYNEKRLHSGIGYMPPNEFEKDLKTTSQT